MLSLLLARLVLEQARRVVADVLDKLNLAFALVLPIVDVINRALLLQPLQQGLVLLSNSLTLLVSDCLIQRLSSKVF